MTDIPIDPNIDLARQISEFVKTTTKGLDKTGQAQFILYLIKYSVSIADQCGVPIETVHMLIDGLYDK